MIECTLANESLACSYPKVCYEQKELGAVVSAHCGCLSNFGYEGANCEVRSTSTQWIMSFYLIAAILPTLFWFWALFKLVPKIIHQVRSNTETTMTSSAILCLVGMGVYCFYIPFLCYQASSGEVDQRAIDGMRVQPLYDIVFHIMFVRIFFYEVNFIFISLAWYQVAYRTSKLKSLKRRGTHSCLVARKMDVISGTLSIALLIVMVAMFATGLQSQLYMFWGVTTTFCLLVWMMGAIYISKTLETMNSSNTFSTTLRMIRKTALLAGCSLLLSAIGMFLQTSRGLPGHEPLPLSSLPPWLVGHVLSVSSVPITYTILLSFHINLGARSSTSSNEAENNDDGSKLTSAKSPPLSTTNNTARLKQMTSAVANSSMGGGDWREGESNA